MKFQKVLGFYDVSRLFIRTRNYCTTAGHNYSISADVVPHAFSWKSEGCVSVCLPRSKKECVTNIQRVFFCVCMCLRLGVDVRSNARRGKPRGCSSPADSCLTAVAEGLGEAVKTPPNKPCVSSSNSTPDITLHTDAALWDRLCLWGNVCHLDKCLRLRHQVRCV